MAELSGELKAMAQIESALKDLDDEERARVMQWAGSRFKVAFKPLQNNEHESAKNSSGGSAVAAGEYATLADLHDAASPKTESNRALVGAYWFQYCQGTADVDAMTINNELKHLGRGVTNITRAFDALKAHKPALIMQIRKEGSSKQARKRYKVTGEGKKAVERMLAEDHE